MPTQESHTDVLIIGAGPSGASAAHALASHGVSVRIVDKRPHGVVAGHGDGVSPRTLEILESYGLREVLAKEGRELHVISFYEPGPEGIHRVRRAPAKATDAPLRFPQMVVHQGHVEKTLLGALEKRGVSVERGSRPVSLQVGEGRADPGAYAVKVELAHTNPEDASDVRKEIVNAKYVIGADGARSWTRQALGITTSGESTEHVWGVMDFTPRTNLPDIRTAAYIHSAHGSLLVIPRERDAVRLYVQIAEHADLLGADGALGNRALVTPERLLEIARRAMAPYTLEMVGEPQWCAAYVIAQRVSDRFSVDERVFIVGDACHTHSPKAGQGMNAGISDSHNLAWKLAHVLRGWAGLPLLKTYELERRQFALDLIAFDRKWAALVSAKSDTTTGSTKASETELADAWTTFSEFISGTGVHYAPSLLTAPSHQHLAAHLTIGKRLPPAPLAYAADGARANTQDLAPADGRFKLLVFAGDIRNAGCLSRLRQFAVAWGEKEGRERWVDVVTVCRTPVLEVVWTDVPEVLRAHWTKVLVDDTDLFEKRGGDVYKSFGIDTTGCAVIVRPDGYVGAVTSLDEPLAVDEYFREGGFVF